MILPNDSLFIKEEQVGGALYDKLLIFHQVCGAPCSLRTLVGRAFPA
jgi:hypothetical protein